MSLVHSIASMSDGSRRCARCGTYGLAVLDTAQPDSIVVTRNGSPVVLGIGEREMFFASGPSALVRHTSSIVRLEDGEIAVVRSDCFETSTLDAVE